MNFIKRTFKSIWTGVKAVLTFFGLIDSKGELSRTNLILYIFTIKFAFVPLQAAGIAELAMAMGSLGLYLGKKVLENRKASVSSEPSDVLDVVRKTTDDMTGE